MRDESMEFSVALAASVHATASNDLVRPDGQEDLAFGIWFPSHGLARDSGLLQTIILPQEDDREVHGNASFSGQYFVRAACEAAAVGGGLAFMHSHPCPGWQDMSIPDRRAEEKHAGPTLAITGKPLLGLTLGTDGTWSARFWPRVRSKTYQPAWCSTVRIIGKGLRISYHPRLVPRYRHQQQLVRTVSFWGRAAQEHLGRMRVGIAGLGSVGSLVNECLARMGVRTIVQIDFDRVKVHNLDRITGATARDAATHAFKVNVAARNAREAATASQFLAIPRTLSVVEVEGYRAALDCDVIFSCVDRPWARRVLNHIAYSHLIPVVDGGILVRNPGGKFRNAYWSARIAGPERSCLECAGSYDPGLVSAERDGYLEDPSYISELPDDSPLRRNENVFPLSMSLAAHEVLQFVALTTGLVGMYDTGEQRFSYFPGYLESHPVSCETNCPFPSLTALGEKADQSVGPFTGRHAAADAERASDQKTRSQSRKTP